MSSNQVAAAVSQEFLENCFTVSAQALCIYDFCLTFTHEVQFMWKLKPSVGSVLFFTLRYTAQCNTIAVVFGYLFSGVWQDELLYTFGTPPDDRRRTDFNERLFSALRIYALSRKNKWHLGVTLILGLINPVLSAVLHIRSIHAFSRAPCARASNVLLRCAAQGRHVRVSKSPTRSELCTQLMSLQP
ncbi:uncharacterized protein B0H18DRAFT_511640 [Fomitopsis serialis]|uniref:uncharacterized protein n=1 Tax=Fomitopsis serialis TaxID=139415 RepID=UPI00200838C0|nr:uncharacterized protein B0H18DRAFT_310886 [Neoantrodia serialis]XP_047891367.1 uncharacterized protein B0H18DRAFT_511640 [Neoantrodia serialis]KAH9911713.1 hypothetical protein B0H18DRAFT_310886 [Neoantrodia serialis]KAH9922453.1 hypothetical protein B0H18DRAFT_511640 [Neoantrodia serialis]